MKVDRIKIYGCTCSGKTTFALQLSEILDIPVFHIDDFFWEENWKQRNPEEFRKDIENIVVKERWILDGNYDRVKDLILPRTTMIVILNPSLFTVYWRLIIRSFARRGRRQKNVTRLPEKITEENRRFSALRSIFELIPHAFKFKHKRLRTLKRESIRLLGKYNVFVLKNKKQIDSFMKALS